MTRIQTWLTIPIFAVLFTGCDRPSGKAPAAVAVGPDITAPTVNATTPRLAATVATSANVKVLFSEEMDSATITASSFTLARGTTPVLAVVTYERNVATLNPIANLEAGRSFTATVHAGAADRAGNALASSRSWTFTTVAEVATRRAKGLTGDDS